MIKTDRKIILSLQDVNNAELYYDYLKFVLINFFPCFTYIWNNIFEISTGFIYKAQSIFNEDDCDCKIDNFLIYVCVTKNYKVLTPKTWFLDTQNLCL